MAIKRTVFIGLVFLLCCCSQAAAAGRLYPLTRGFVGSPETVDPASVVAALLGQDIVCNSVTASEIALASIPTPASGFSTLFLDATYGHLSVKYDDGSTAALDNAGGSVSSPLIIDAIETDLIKPKTTAADLKLQLKSDSYDFSFLNTAGTEVAKIDSLGYLHTNKIKQLASSGDFVFALNGTGDWSFKDVGDVERAAISKAGAATFASIQSAGNIWTGSSAGSYIKAKVYKPRGSEDMVFQLLSDSFGWSGRNTAGTEVWKFDATGALTQKEIADDDVATPASSFATSYVTTQPNLLAVKFDDGTTATVAMEDTAGQLIQTDETGTDLVCATADVYTPWISADAIAAGSTGSIGAITVTTGADTKFTVNTGGKGRYLMSYAISCVPENSAETHHAIFINSTKYAPSVLEHVTASPARTTALSMCCMAPLRDGDVVTLQMSSGTDGDNILLHHVQLTAVRMFKY